MQATQFLAHIYLDINVIIVFYFIGTFNLCKMGDIKMNIKHVDTKEIKFKIFYNPLVTFKL